MFEEDLALAILHADLAYINCSLEHELPQNPSHGNHPSPSPAQFPTAKVVRSTLEETTFDPRQPSSRLSSVPNRENKTNAIPNPSVSRDEIESSPALLVSVWSCPDHDSSIHKIFLPATSQASTCPNFEEYPLWSGRR